MNKEDLKIAVVGTSAEELADKGFGGSWSKTAALSEEIKSNHKNTELFDVNTKQDLEKIAEQKPDLVFIASKYIEENNEKIWLPEFFEEKGINYTGPDKRAMEVDLDKVAAKEIVSENGIATAPHFVISADKQYHDNSDIPLDFPLVVKPRHGLNSYGVDENSLVNDVEGLNKKVQQLRERFGEDAIAEKYLSGDEFTVVVTGDGESLKANPIQVIPQQASIITEKEKDENTEKLLPVKDEELKNKLSEFAKNAHTALGARDHSRVDVRMDENGELNFLEITTTPGFSHEKDRSYMKQAIAISEEKTQEQVFKETVKEIVDSALERQLQSPLQDIAKNMQTSGVMGNKGDEYHKVISNTLKPQNLSDNSKDGFGIKF